MNLLSFFNLKNTLNITSEDIFNNIKNALILLDKNNRIIKINNKAKTIFSKRNSECINAPIHTLISDYDTSKEYIEFETVDRINGTVNFYSAIQSEMIKNKDLFGRLLLIRDITVMKFSEGKLEKTIETILKNDTYMKLRQKIWNIAAVTECDEKELIQKLFNAVGPVLDISRVCFNHIYGKYFINIVEWHNINITPSLNTQIPEAIIRILLKKDHLELNLFNIEENTPKIFRNPIKLFFSELFQNLDIISVLIVPCYIEEKLEAIITFDICKGNKFGLTWPNEKRAIIPDIVQIISQILSRKRMSNSLKKSKGMYKALFDNMFNGFAYHKIILNKNNKPVDYEFLNVNKEFEKIFNINAVKIIGKKFSEINLFDNNDGINWIEEMSNLSIQGGLVKKDIYLNSIRKWVSIIGYSPIRNYFAIVIEDITERKQYVEKLKFYSTHDLLTGFPNRRALDERLNDIIAIANRYNDDNLRAVLFIGLTNFKSINESLGHKAGDIILAEIGNSIKNSIRNSDLLFRFSGDQFVVILNNITLDTDAVKVSKKLLNTISFPINYVNHEIKINARIGISLFPRDGHTSDLLLQNSNTAMHNTKEQEVEYLFFSKDMNARAKNKIFIENELRKAADNDELRLFYQPIVNSDRKIIGAEALLRWFHPSIGLIGPDKFIPIAEQTGLIISIGEWVIKTACERLKELQNNNSDFYISINLSLKQFRDENLINRIDNIIKETDTDPRKICLEITESSIMNNPEKVIERMDTLRKMGFNISIDDFGTGYSSLSYLSRFPISSLKIDRSFICNLHDNSNCQLLVKAIINLAHGLKLNVVAEGIEEEEQHNYITDLDCDSMQGYLYGKPVNIDDFHEINNTYIE